MTIKYWLLKAEPDSRIVKNKDVKFSVDDFESVKTTPWEGVRNYEARNLMKEMKIGDKALFYHSNCKNPGIAAFAEVSKEAYPDHTAWDASHPYYDAKTNKEEPRWYMIDLTFVSRTKWFIPLALLRHIADLPSLKPPDEISYIGEDGVQAIKGMDLVVRGRLSVQRVAEKTWHVIEMMAERGGWDEMDLKSKKPAGAASKSDRKHSRQGRKKSKRPRDGESTCEVGGDDGGEEAPHNEIQRKRKHDEVEKHGPPTPRRSTRIKR